MTLNYIKLYTVNFCCINRYNARNFILTLGTINRNNPDDGFVVQSSMNSIVHEEYNGMSLDYDIAVINLTVPVEFSRKYLHVLRTVYKLQHLESLVLVM